LKTRVTTSTGVFVRTLTAITLAAAAACATDPTSPVAGPAPSAAADVADAGPEYVPGEVLVKFRAGATAQGRGAAMRAANAQAGERIVTSAMRRTGDGEGITVVRTGLGVPAAIQALRNSPDVEYAEPNWVYRHQLVSNDPQFTNGTLWGMSANNNAFGSRAASAWGADRTDCSNVYVGIIDEGYMYDHEDLAANAGKNPGEIAGNGSDDDGNGYVDDVYGWDFDGNYKSVFDGTGDDHGTHVAGTIGGVGGNGKGVAGVCWDVKLLNAKFLGRNGGTTANAVKAVDYMTDFKTRHGVRLVATNNSWGGGGYSKALDDAIARANAANILFIVAAGNSTYDCDTSTACYPAEYTQPNVLSVASITSTGAISSFSNYGGATIHIGAPGSAIMSTVPTSARGRIASGYTSYSGTSMATPHVSGAAALYAAYNTTATAATIKNALLSSAVTTASLVGKTTTGGRLDVNAALAVTTVK
jgi:subtilisin family serine protease